MPKALKRNSVIVAGLAAIFYVSFMFAKHDPALREVIPFGEDPYDAVGSFGVVIGAMLALLCLKRAFWPYDERGPSPAQRVYLVRSQEAVVLIVLITLVADTVALARHPHWYQTHSRDSLVALLGALGLVTAGVHLLVRGPREVLPMVSSGRRRQAVVAALIAVVVLAVYPEQLIEATATHLVTVVVGAAILFAPMRPLLTVLVPYEAGETTAAAPVHRARSASCRWGLVFLLGAVIGGCLFAGEMSEGSGALPLGRAVFVACVFVGLTIAGLVIAYAFLGVPLGLTRQR